MTLPVLQLYSNKTLCGTKIHYGKVNDNNIFASYD